MAEWVAIQEALLRGTRHCRYHNSNFGALGWEGPEEESLPRCDSCKQPWRVARALNALDAAVRASDVHVRVSAERDAAEAANADLTDRLDRTLHELREVAGERDRERKHCEQMTLVADRYANERDAANAALAAVSDLLDEARTERDAARAQVADAEGVCDIAQAAFDYHDCDPGTDDCEHAWYVLKGAIGHYRALKAREYATLPAEVQP